MGRAGAGEPAAPLTPRYRMGLRAGELVPLARLLEGVAIASANDAATAVAEHLGGTEGAFVGRHERQGARSWGFTPPTSPTPTACPIPAQRSTAADLARLIATPAPRLSRRRGRCWAAQTFVYRGRVYSRRIPLFQDPGGVQALKTGFTREAGYNLAISAWRVGQHFVLIVLGSQTRSLSFRDAKTCSATASRDRPRGRAPAGGPAVKRRPRAPRRPGERRRARDCQAPAEMARSARLRLRRLRHALRRPLGRRGRRATITRDPPALSLLWRQKQLEYTWLRSLMGRYEDFWVVTEPALRYAIRRLGITATEAQVRAPDGRLSLARRFPEVPAALGRLAGTPLRHPLERLAAHAGGRGALERPRRLSSPTSLGRRASRTTSPRRWSTSLAPALGVAAGRDPLRVVERLGRGRRQSLRLPGPPGATAPTRPPRSWASTPDYEVDGSRCDKLHRG